MEHKFTRKPCVIFKTEESIEDEELDKTNKSQTMNLVQAQLEDSIKNPYQFLNKKKVPETFVSQEIRVISEVEKIWILYDLDDNGTILCDDYNLSQAPGVKQAIDEFVNNNNLKSDIIFERFAKIEKN